jgi:DNA invertase Pin-like site-specific DNA recombinase
MDLINKKIIIYARVSTKNQDTEAQLFKLKEYCKNHNYQIVETLEDI